MSVDGINAIIGINQSQAIHLILLFDLKYSHRLRSSETNFLFIGEIDHLIIEVKFKHDEYTLTLRGSLHKNYHKSNSGDFLYPELQTVTNRIYELFRMDSIEVYPNGKIKAIDQLKFLLNRSEVGINILVGIDNLHDFLDINLLQHKRKKFTCDDGLVFTCKHENYHLKIYPKDDNLLRIEIVLFTRELKKYKIFTLADLTKEKIIPILQRLKLEFSEIQFSDGIDIYSCNDITGKEELKLLRHTSDWRNKQYLINTKVGTKKERKNLRQQIWRLGTDSKKILETKGKGYKKVLVDAVNQKIDSLII